MWKYVKFVIGLLLLFVGVFAIVQLATGGMQKSFHETGKRLRENAIATTGEIEGVYRRTTTARIGRIGGYANSYFVKYTFKTSAGTKYGGQFDISSAQVGSFAAGAPLRVKYHKSVPSISSAVGYENDHSAVAENEPVPVGLMIFTAMLFLLGGGWLTWSNGQRIFGGGSGRALRANLNYQTAVPMRSVQGMSPANRGGFGRR